MVDKNNVRELYATDNKLTDEVLPIIAGCVYECVCGGGGGGGGGGGRYVHKSYYVDRTHSVPGSQYNFCQEPPPLMHGTTIC